MAPAIVPPPKSSAHLGQVSCTRDKLARIMRLNPTPKDVRKPITCADSTTINGIEWKNSDLAAAMAKLDRVAYEMAVRLNDDALSEDENRALVELCHKRPSQFDPQSYFSSSSLDKLCSELGIGYDSLKPVGEEVVLSKSAPTSGKITRRGANNGVPTTQGLGPVQVEPDPINPAIPATIPPPPPGPPPGLPPPAPGPPPPPPPGPVIPDPHPVPDPEDAGPIYYLPNDKGGAVFGMIVLAVVGLIILMTIIKKCDECCSRRKNDPDSGFSHSKSGNPGDMIPVLAEPEDDQLFEMRPSEFYANSCGDVQPPEKTYAPPGVEGAHPWEQSDRSDWDLLPPYEEVEADGSMRKSEEARRSVASV
ncbi:Formin-like protein 1 [Loxospora ochrophaea]|nr:Formin-like protein 1 [Loxospora ochrophaea]